MIDRSLLQKSVEIYGVQKTKFVELMLKDLSRFLAALQETVGLGDCENLALAAHSVKSLFRQVEAVEAADAALALEQAGKTRDLPQARAAFERLVPLAREVDEALRGLL